MSDEDHKENANTPVKNLEDNQGQNEKYPIPIGARVYHDEKCKLEQMTHLEHGVAVVTISLYTAWPYILLMLLCFSFVPAVLVVNIVIFSTLMLPSPLFWDRFLKWNLFRLWRQYFSFSYYMEEKLPPTEKYVFAEFPHGTFPMGPVLAATLIPVMFPGEKVYSLAASILFKIPLYRHFMCWMGSQPATRKHFNQLISKASVAITVGGIAEMFMQHETKEQVQCPVLMSRRKGFIRLALTNGVDIVPVFHFGNSRVLSIGPKCLIEICRKLRMSIGIMIGRWGLPIPKPHPIYMVVGRRVKVPQAVSPDDKTFLEAVDDLHARVVEEVKRLYDAHKDEFGWKDRPLEVV